MANIVVWLRKCCIIYDFDDPFASVKEKEAKTILLQQILRSVPSQPSDEFYSTLFEMRTSRMVGCTCHALQFDVILEPSWPHLCLVYQILWAALNLPCLKGGRYIDQGFVSKLVRRLNNKDPRERNMLKQLIDSIYQKHVHVQSFVKNAVFNALVEFVHKDIDHAAIPELLEIQENIMDSGDWTQFFERILVPMHGKPSLEIFRSQLENCVNKLITKNKKLKVKMVSGLLRNWPVSGARQVFFLEEIHKLLKTMGQKDFDTIAEPLLVRLSICISLFHPQIAERVLRYWQCLEIRTKLSQQAKLVESTMANPLSKIAESDSPLNHSALCLLKDISSRL